MDTELAEIFGQLDEEQSYGPGELGGPLVVGVFRTWVLKKLMSLGCEYKDQIKEVAVRAIVERIKNQVVQTILIEVLSTAIEAICPEA